MADSDSDSFVGETFPFFQTLSITPLHRKLEKETRKNPFFSFDCSNWLTTLEQYIKEVKPASLDLTAKGLKAEELVTIFKWLQESSVTDVCLEYNNLNRGMAELSEILVETKVQKLDISNCNLSVEDLLHLMEVLKDTQITDLDVTGNNKMMLRSDTDRNKFISHLLESHLVTFKFDVKVYNDGREERRITEIFPLLRILPDTSLTFLAFSEPWFDDVGRLFPILRHTHITKLGLDCECVSRNIRILSEALKYSKVKELYIRSNELNDFQLDVLAEGLIQSKVTDLDLSNNLISGNNNLGTILKNTQIEYLNLSSNPIKNKKMFNFPNFLKDTSIKYLHLADCELSDDFGQELIRSLKFSSAITRLVLSENKLRRGTISEFIKVVKLTNISVIDFSGNDLPHDAITLLGDSFQGSKLQNFQFCTYYYERKFINQDLSAKINAIATLVGKTKGSSIQILNLSESNLSGTDLEIIGANIENSSITQLHLRSNPLEFDGISYLIPHLKFTAITHLDVSDAQIKDAGAEALVKCLKDTKIVDLNISENCITSDGAKAIAPYLQGTKLLSVKLNDNLIQNDGLEALAEAVENTFIILSVRRNYGQRKLLVDRIVFKNRILMHQVIGTFKELVPQIQSNNFCPNDVEGSDINAYLEKHFLFFKTIIDNPSAINVLAQEEGVNLTEEQIVCLLFEKFPRQLAFFVASQIGPNVTQQVSILKRVEELKLNVLAENLLLNRPVYYIDEEQGILHPYVYPLLYKYKLPMFHADIEPGGKEKILNHFMEHRDIVGASDVIQLLRD